MLQQSVPEARSWNGNDLDRRDKEGSTPERHPPEVEQQITKVARRDSTVLITGESGTGKELVADEIHHRSARCGGPFIFVDCTGLPNSLFESLLFGHAKGAFTGAERPSCGFVRAADGGTLFLDEFAELSLASQAKLLRCLEDKRVVPLGMHTAVATDVRIIAATHRDLWSMVRRSRFREDLYYRVHVVPIHLPPLRERGDEVVRLARHFLLTIAERDGEPVKLLAPDAVAALRAHTWPGNIRELANAVECAVAMSDYLTIHAADLPDTANRKAEGTNRSGNAATLSEIERSAVVHALRANRWHKTRAANQLGIKRQTLYRLIKRHRLSASA